MTFWEYVGLSFVLLFGLGLAIGAYFGTRSRRHEGGHGGSGGMSTPPTPSGPTHDAPWPDDWLPLGTAFDRDLLPAAFADELAPAAR